MSKYRRPGDNLTMINQLCTYNENYGSGLVALELADEKSMLKPTLLLAVGLFLLFSPSPDAQVIAELTSNFLVLI